MPDEHRLSIPPRSARLTIVGAAGSPATVPDDFETFFHDGVPIGRHDGVPIGRPRGEPMEAEVYPLYLGLRALELRYGDDHSALRRRIVSAVVERIRSCGGFFVHGSGDGGPAEVHLRFTSAAIRLLIEACRDGLLDEAALVWEVLTRHLSYSEPLEGGAVWFLHDSLERPGLHHPRRGVKNAVWGSSAANTLTLNTHVDTLNTLLYARRFGDLLEEQRGELDRQIAAGLAALELALRGPCGKGAKAFASVDRWARSQIFRGMGARHPRRALGAALRRAYFPIRPRLKSRLPVLRFPEGHLERDIGFSRGEGFYYQWVNVWDLSKLAWQLEKTGVSPRLVPELRAATRAGLDYAFDSPHRAYLERALSKRASAVQLCEALMTHFARGELLDERSVGHYVAVRRRVPPSPALLGYDPVVTDGLAANEVTREVSHAADTPAVDVIPCGDGCLLVNNGHSAAGVRLDRRTVRLEQAIGRVSDAAGRIELGPGSAAVLARRESPRLLD